MTLDVGAMAAELLRRNLRNPDSFALEDVRLTESDAFCFTYRAQNGFGGMNREHAVIHQKSQTFEAEGQPGFESAWHRRCQNKAAEDVTEEIQSRAEIARQVLPKTPIE